ncbi:MAG TPA: DUF5597 domain-containing protein [Abditibacterium sp.]
MSKILSKHVLLLTLAALFSAHSASAQTTPANSLPRLVSQNGRHALFVDGAPFLMLGAQVHNSSVWPALLPKVVWPAMKDLGVNTVEAPISWEQMEPQPGKFDFSVVDLLVKQARENKVRLVLLWFGTWKNGSNHYMPAWMKLQPQLYPNIVSADGRPIDSPSPHAPATLAADVRAYSALMRHLKQIDEKQHTVIMVQVQNEPGTWGGVRDFSPLAQQIFNRPVPDPLLKALGKPVPAANWREAFGDDADEFFHAYSIARFIEQVAAAGKAIYPLPTLVNAALRDPLVPSRPPSYESGGPTDNVLAIYKAAAPSIDLLAPDIYQNEDAKYRRVLELYNRPDNALMVPETGSGAGNARYFYTALHNGAIGFAPFGLDYANFATPPTTPPENFAAFALNYRTFGPMARQIARLNFEGKVQAVAEFPQPSAATSTSTPTRIAPQTLRFGDWEIDVAYGPRNGPGFNPTPLGRALVAQLGANQFLVTGLGSRVNFRPVGAHLGKAWQFLRVEEGQYENGVFQPIRIWNGDETDWGLQFRDASPVVRVSLYTR